MAGNTTEQKQADTVCLQIGRRDITEACNLLPLQEKFYLILIKSLNVNDNLQKIHETDV